MRPGNFKAVLPLTLVIVSLVAPMLALTNISEATVYEAVENIFVRGKDTAYSYNNNPPAPIKTYVGGDCPPVMMAIQIGSGGVVASGVVTECRMSPSSDNFVALMDEIFKWLVPGGTKVLWFDGYGVYCTSSTCSDLITKLSAKGYTTTGKATTPITSSMLEPYDILVLPELQLGSAGQGGNPDLLPDSDVQAIKNFVEGGNGLLIMSGSDFFGPSGDKGNFYNVMNKVLINLSFGWGGKLFGFQSDSVYDDVVNSKSTTDVPTPGGDAYRPIVDVNPAHPIGAGYQADTGRTTFRAYGGCSLTELGPGMATYIIPEYQVGMPGETVTYRFRVFNTGTPIPGAENVDLTIDLTVSDNSGWGPTLDNYLLRLPKGENKTVILSVTIPSGANLSTEDKIVVTAAAREYPQVRENKILIACAGKRLEVTEDAYVSDQDPEMSYNENSLYIGRYENFWEYAYLKFNNLAEIPSGASITGAKLYLFCWRAYGSPQEMLCTGVEDDSWQELWVTWNNKPTPGATLDTKIVSIGAEIEPKAYYWDVTPFVRNELAGDKIASFCIRPANNCPPSTNRRFEAKDWWDNRVRPFLRVIYTTGAPVPGVNVSISPSSRDGLPGAALTYTVTVTNTGGVVDNYVLTKSDNAGWGPTLSENLLTNVGSGTSRTVTLTVTILAGAESCTRDSITVIATSQTDNTVSDSASCVAHCVGEVPGKGVQVSISPASKSGKPGEELNFSVTVTNTGTSTDTFTLTVSDTEDWGPTIAITSTTLPAEGSRQNIRLSITIPSTAANGDSTTITVSATGTGYENSATCTATVGAVAGGISPFVYIGAAVVIVVIIAAILIVKPF